MNLFSRYREFCVALLLTWVANGAFAQSSDTSSVPSDVRIEFDDGLLTLVTHDAPLHEVVREIGHIAGFELVLVGSHAEAPRVSVSFENLPLREAVERLIEAENRIIVSAPPADGTGPGTIAQVWLLQAGTETADFAASDARSIASGSEQDVRAFKLARMTAMLQPEKPETVRAWAASALGTFQDDRAVLALESALFDEAPSVRLEAINALGRIGSEQASLALTGILLNKSADETERAAANRALKRHDTAAAREYLGAVEGCYRCGRSTGRGD